jgi:pseudouridine kinase
VRVAGAPSTHERGRTTAPAGRIVVVGGANLDVFGFSDAQFIPRDSNPGRIEESPGGVARNIAENLARLGIETHLITAFGCDATGLHLAEECRRDGILADSSLSVEHVPGSRYLAILDDDGNLASAVSDMRALDALTPAVLADRTELLASADLIVADTNLPLESLRWLARESTTKLLLDPVSAAKASRARGALPHVHTLKLNALEAGAILGREVNPTTENDVVRAGEDLRALGAKRVFVTLGPLGVFAQDAGGTVRLAAPPVRVANATGAGDAFTAGVACGTLQGMTLPECAALGSAMAAAALTSKRTVSESIDLSAIRSAMKEILS